MNQPSQAARELAGRILQHDIGVIGHAGLAELIQSALDAERASYRPWATPEMQLREELAALSEDRDRLDWLFSQYGQPRGISFRDRAAIDLARKKTDSPPDA